MNTREVGVRIWTKVPMELSKPKLGKTLGIYDHLRNRKMSRLSFQNILITNNFVCIVEISQNNDFILPHWHCLLPIGFWLCPCFSLLNLVLWLCQISSNLTCSSAMSSWPWLSCVCLRCWFTHPWHPHCLIFWPRSPELWTFYCSKWLPLLRENGSFSSLGENKCPALDLPSWFPPS